VRSREKVELMAKGGRKGVTTGISCLMRTRAIAVGELDIYPPSSPFITLSSVRIFANWTRRRHVASTGNHDKQISGGRANRVAYCVHSRTHVDEDRWYGLIDRRKIPAFVILQ